RSERRSVALDMMVAPGARVPVTGAAPPSRYSRVDSLFIPVYGTDTRHAALTPLPVGVRCPERCEARRGAGMKRTSVIDVDIHPTYNPERVLEYLPEAWKPRFLAGNRGPGTLGYWNPGGVARADAVTDDGQRIGHDPHLLASHVLDEYSVEFCVLNPEAGIHIGVSPELDYSAALLSAINDHFIEDWLPVDSRYRLSITVAPNDPVGAAAEIRRVGNAPGVVQVVMGSGARTSYGNRFYYPIYEAAQEMGLPVAIHPGNEGVGITGPTGAAGFASNYFEWHSGLVTSYITHLISLVTEGVFIRFPEMKFV